MMGETKQGSARRDNPPIVGRGGTPLPSVECQRDLPLRCGGAEEEGTEYFPPISMSFMANPVFPSSLRLRVRSLPVARAKMQSWHGNCYFERMGLGECGEIYGLMPTTNDRLKGGAPLRSAFSASPRHRASMSACRTEVADCGELVTNHPLIARGTRSIFAPFEEYALGMFRGSDRPGKYRPHPVRGQWDQSTDNAVVGASVLTIACARD